MRKRSSLSGHHRYETQTTIRPIVQHIGGEPRASGLPAGPGRVPIAASLETCSTVRYCADRAPRFERLSTGRIKGEQRVNQLALVLSLSLSIVACATEEPVAPPPPSETPTPEPAVAASPPAVAEPAPQVEVVTPAATPEPLPAPAPVAKGAKPAQPAHALARVSQTLHAVAGTAACTEKRCPESEPCCNRCDYLGWKAKGAGPASHLKLRGIAVPAPKQDGCGVAFDLELTGRSDGEDFYVESFKKLPPTKR